MTFGDQLDWTRLPPPPDPPTGPEADVPTPDDNRPATFLLWRASEEGTAYWQALERDALFAFKMGDKRFSPRDHSSQYRARPPHVKINNTYTAWLADELVMRHPELEAIIERRRRRKAGPFAVG